MQVPFTCAVCVFIVLSTGRVYAQQEQVNPYYNYPAQGWILPGEDNDTRCAVAFAVLSDDSGNGPGNDFDVLSQKAQHAYLERNPGEDASRYNLRIASEAQSIEQAMTQGKMTLDTLRAAAAACNARY